jgi:DNA mismatch repair protein MutS2
MPPADLPAPDLLCADARFRLDATATREALVFAFAAGGSIEVFDDVVARASIGPSSWRRSAFARDLYLDEVAAKTLALRIGGKAYPTCTRYLVRILGEPPDDARDLALRRGVLEELASSPAMRAEAERAYLAVLRIRALMGVSRQPAPRVRRVEILRAARDAFDGLAASFGGATSGLARLNAFGAAVVAGEGYGRLRALLDHEENLGSLDLRVRVGADGEVRAMEIVRVHEGRGNPFYVPVLRRFFARVALAFRGYRTTSQEIAERLLSEVFGGVEDAVALLLQLAGDLELYLGALSFRDRAAARGLSVSLPEMGEPGGELRVEGLFNPLLLETGVQPVPTDVRAGRDALVLVTGPNSGGKTRLLQALATAQLLAQVGLFVPARAAWMPRATGLFASLFEEARADQPEGHLGMELLRIRRLFDELGSGALVVIDELCSGTNPSEGEEIARMVLSLLPELGVRSFVTTHLLLFAAGLAAESSAMPLEFLQVELDAQEQPTYRFVPGVARTSLANRTASRLGVTRDELLARIAAKKAARRG